MSDFSSAPEARRSRREARLNRQANRLLRHVRRAIAASRRLQEVLDRQGEDELDEDARMTAEAYRETAEPLNWLLRQVHDIAGSVTIMDAGAWQE